MSHDAVNDNDLPDGEPESQTSSDSPAVDTSAASGVASEASNTSPQEFQYIPIHKIVPSTTNTRTLFEGQEYDDFVDDIRSRGVLQPILVRPVTFDDDLDERLYDALEDAEGMVKGPGPEIGDAVFEIIGGERRWRAAVDVGLETIPCRVLLMDDDAAYEGQLVENLQRANLSPVEEARGYANWLERQETRQVVGLEASPTSRKALIEQLAERVHKDTRTIYERLQILGLVPEAIAAVESGRIGASAATVLVRASEAKQREFAAKAEDGESVTVASLKAELTKNPKPVVGGGYVNGKWVSEDRDASAGELGRAQSAADLATDRAKTEAAWRKRDKERQEQLRVATEAQQREAIKDAAVYHAIMGNVASADFIALRLMIGLQLSFLDISIEGAQAIAKQFGFMAPDSNGATSIRKQLEAQYHLHQDKLSASQLMKLLLSTFIAPAIGGDDEYLDFGRKHLDALATKYKVDAAKLRKGAEVKGSLADKRVKLAEADNKIVREMSKMLVSKAAKKPATPPKKSKPGSKNTTKKKAKKLVKKSGAKGGKK